MSTGGRAARRIVVGVDGSEGSVAALRWAVPLARALDAEIIVVHVVELTTYDTRPLGLPLPVLNEAEWREAIRTELEGRWCEPLAEAGIHHRTRIEEGRAGPCLAAVARSERADLVVTGRRGLTEVAELVQDSVSHYLTHHAPCPLAVVPAAAHTAAA
jgi:nucleotide-binding universal stress UspA family protein